MSSLKSYAVIALFSTTAACGVVKVNGLLGPSTPTSPSSGTSGGQAAAAASPDEKAGATIAMKEVLGELDTITSPATQGERAKGKAGVKKEDRARLLREFDGMRVDGLAPSGYPDAPVVKYGAEAIADQLQQADNASRRLERALLVLTPADAAAVRTRFVKGLGGRTVVNADLEDGAQTNVVVAGKQPIERWRTPIAAFARDYAQEHELDVALVASLAARADSPAVFTCSSRVMRFVSPPMEAFTIPGEEPKAIGCATVTKNSEQEWLDGANSHAVTRYNKLPDSVRALSVQAIEGKRDWTEYSHDQWTNKPDRWQLKLTVYSREKE